MKDNVSDLFLEFMDEFEERLGLVMDEQNGKSFQIVTLLLEYMEIKYKNKLKKFNNESFFKRIIPFFNPATDFDPFLEEELNHKLDLIVENSDTISNSTELVPCKKTSFDKILSDIKNDIGRTKYSKTSFPSDIELAMVMDPLDGKNQDHLDFQVLPDGSIILVLCDGVSGDGKASKQFAEEVTTELIAYLQETLSTNLSIEQWEEVIKQGIDTFLEQTHLTKGATTLIVSYLPYRKNTLYTSWLGDGNILLFNKSLTGYGKLLIPHQNLNGQLNGVITSDGILGKITSSILHIEGGTLIISSDGFNLTNGKLLRHFYQKVLKQENLNEKLKVWTAGKCCDNEAFHPKATDDRSMIILNWS